MFGRETHYYKKGIEKYLSYIFGDLVLGRRLRFFYVKNILDKTKKNEKVFDAGCGQGQYSFYLDKKGVKVFSLDINSENIKNCKFVQKKLGNSTARFVVGNLLNFKKEDYFDKIIAFDVTHYVGDKDIIIFRNFYTSLKKGGKLILSVPNKKGRNKYFEYRSEKYSKREIIDILKKSGFKNISIKAIGNNFFSKLNSFSRRVIIHNSNFFSKLIVFLLFLFSPVLVRIDKYSKSKYNSNWLILAEK